MAKKEIKKNRTKVQKTQYRKQKNWVISDSQYK